MNKGTKKTLLWISLFALAMGFLETSVVVYLREIYYPNGFQFPLVIIPNKIALVEFWREIATIIMLLGAGIIAGKTKLSRFAYFIIAFAVWDIFYYIFLYLLLQWPQSLFTWDILFLVPIPWTGPVIAPCIVSFGMIVFGVILIYFTEKNVKIKISFSNWLILLSGVLVILSSFMWDYVSVTYHNHQGFWTINSHSNLFEEIKMYVPTKFNWLAFHAGTWICVGGMIISFRNFKKQITNP